MGIDKVDFIPGRGCLWAKLRDGIVGIRTLHVRCKRVIESRRFNYDRLVVATLVCLYTKEAGRKMETRSYQVIVIVIQVSEAHAESTIRSIHGVSMARYSV